jgi:thiol:disulfide interchange protein DsbG
MNKAQIVLAALTAGLLLSACKDTPAPGASPKAAAAAPVSVAAIDAEARGFTVGSAMSVRTVYVFFDPQCPHCAKLWESAKPLKSQAKFVWIPVALMNKTSESQGATLLAAKDPVAAMDEHETSILANKGGISASGDYEARKADVEKNTELHKRFGFASIPTIVAQHAQTGAVVTREGALATPELATLLGLQAPGAK